MSTDHGLDLDRGLDLDEFNTEINDGLDLDDELDTDLDDELDTDLDHGRYFRNPLRALAWIRTLPNECQLRAAAALCWFTPMRRMMA